MNRRSPPERRRGRLLRLGAAAYVAAGMPAAPVSVDRAVLPGGGGTMQSARFSVTGSAGQAIAVTTPSAGARFADRAGFWSQTLRWLNAVPVAAGASVTVRGTAATSITLTAVDGDGDPVTFSVVSGPTWGTLTGAGPGLLYTPGGGFSTSDSFTFAANDGIAGSASATILLERTRVVGRWVFYNQSVWDGNAVGADARDDAAVATDKTALLTGVKAGFESYTSYSRGLNGIMVDVDGLPLGVSLTAADFAFRAGNNNTVSGWTVAPAPLEIGGVSVRRGAGAGSSDRITLVWGSDAVSKKWLQIRVKANALTGLWQDDIFYFGNAIGETGNKPGADAIVDATDEILARNNLRSPFSPAPVTFKYDFNRDKQVNATDQIAARLNTTSAFTALRLITPAAAAAAAPALAGFFPGSPAAAADDALDVPDADGGAVPTSVAPDAAAGGWPLGVLALADGRIVLHGRTADGRRPRLEMASDPGHWEPVPYSGESYRDGEWVWLVGPPAENSGRFFRLARP